MTENNDREQFYEKCMYSAMYFLHAIPRDLVRVFMFSCRLVWEFFWHMGKSIVLFLIVYQLFVFFVVYPLRATLRLVAKILQINILNINRRNAKGLWSKGLQQCERCLLNLAARIHRMVENDTLG
jgi:hypothetical protein